MRYYHIKKVLLFLCCNCLFDSAELAFLADAVQVSKLSVVQKQTLTNQLMTTMGDYQATELTAAAQFGTMPKRNHRYYNLYDRCVKTSHSEQ